jgi:hypothetical protein
MDSKNFSVGLLIMYYRVSWVQAIVPSGAWCAYEEFRRAKISELAENSSETGGMDCTQCTPQHNGLHDLHNGHVGFEQWLIEVQSFFDWLYIVLSKGKSVQLKTGRKENV